MRCFLARHQYIRPSYKAPNSYGRNSINIESIPRLAQALLLNIKRNYFRHRFSTRGDPRKGEE